MFKFDLKSRLKDGNDIKILRDGEEFFPRLFEKIALAEREVFIETFILEEDSVGKALRNELINAAQRGVIVVLTVDSWGSFYLPDDYIESLVQAGVVLQIYDPQPAWLKARPKMVNRLHRKVAVIDNTYAYVGGINLCEDHLTQDRPVGKRDYVAEMTGPVVKDVRSLCLNTMPKSISQIIPSEGTVTVRQTASGKCKAALIMRNNWNCRADIEKAYLEKIHEAKNRILIANAYIFPSYRFVRAIRQAAKRGVNVKIVTQGKPDLPYTLYAAQSIYKKLVLDGVEMYEYLSRPLHGKIAAIDDSWSTIGSSNLDPWSLGSNMETNLFIENADINRRIKYHIDELISESKRINMEWIDHRPIVDAIRDTLLYHCVRWWPALVRCLPNERPNIQCLGEENLQNKLAEMRNRRTYKRGRHTGLGKITAS